MLPHKSVNSKIIGIGIGAIAAITYGMNPLFALPLYQEGFTPDAVLLMRYLPAVFLLGIWLPLKGERLGVTRQVFPFMISAGLLFALCSLTLFMSYTKMDAGIASTILFVYPVMTAIIMWLFLHERFRMVTVISLVLALGGIALLYRKSDGSLLDTTGVVLVFISALTYAVYLVQGSFKVFQNVSPLKTAFYTVTICTLFFAIRLLCGCGRLGIFTPKAIINILFLALLPTIVSLSCTNFALQKAGSTITAILGALEPLTAVFFGVIVFHEEFTLRIAMGIVLILSSVILIVLCNAREKKTE